MSRGTPSLAGLAGRQLAARCWRPVPAHKSIAVARSENDNAPVVSCRFTGGTCGPWNIKSKRLARWSVCSGRSRSLLPSYWCLHTSPFTGGQWQPVTKEAPRKMCALSTARRSSGHVLDDQDRRLLGVIVSNINDPQCPRAERDRVSRLPVRHRTSRSWAGAPRRRGGAARTCRTRQRASSSPEGFDPRPRETRPVREARRAVTADLGVETSRH